MIHYLYWFILCVLIINFISAFGLIFIERKDPTTTWAWLLVITVLPVIGILIYLFLGQNLSRQKIFKEKIVYDERKRKSALPNGFADRKLPHVKLNYFSDLEKMNYNNSGAKTSINNTVSVFVDGEDKFKALLEDLKNAKKYIHMEYYIFRKDMLGSKIINILTQKAKEGVEVRFLVDAMGSRRITKKRIKEFIDAGGKFAMFFPGILPHINTHINYRNHRKIVVVDGKYGYVGGFNVGKEYINRDPEFGFWRDTHIRISGDAVNDLNERFLLDWCYASGEKIDDYDYYVSTDIDESFSKDNNVCMQVVTSGPDHKEEYIKYAYIKMINDAKKYVYLETPYFVPDEPMLEALRIAALSGVDVRIIIPGKADHFFMKWAASAYIGDLLEVGVKVYMYGNGFIHAKTIVADGAVMSIGTANMDIRSFRLNFEVSAFIYDDRIALNGTEQFQKDMEVSKEVTPVTYKNRPRILKICESLVRLLSPIL